MAELGPTLEEAVASGRRMSSAAALGLARDLAGQAQTLHARGTVHGRIRPSLVRFSDSGSPVLLPAPPAPPALPDGFDAPEGPGVPGDVFALGAVTYCSLAGGPPPADQAELGRRIGSLAASPCLRAILRKALAPEPADRYRSAAELRAAAVACLEQAPRRGAPRWAVPAALAVLLAASFGVWRALRPKVPSAGKLVWRCKAHPGHSEGLAFAPDGTMLASSGITVGGGSEVKLWDAGACRELRRWGCPPVSEAESKGWPTKLAFSPDGRTLAFACMAWNEKANRRDFGSVEMVDIETGARRASLKGYPGAIVALSFDPAGERVLSASTGTGPAAGGELRIHRAADGALEDRFAEPQAALGSAAWALDGMAVAYTRLYGSEAGELVVRSWPDWKELYKNAERVGTIFPGAVRGGPGGRLAVGFFASELFRLCAPDGRTCSGLLNEEILDMGGLYGDSTGGAFSEKPALFAAPFTTERPWPLSRATRAIDRCKTVVRVWAAESSRLVGQLETGSAQGIALSRDGAWLAATEGDGFGTYLQLWKLDPGALGRAGL